MPISANSRFAATDGGLGHTRIPAPPRRVGAARITAEVATRVALMQSGKIIANGAPRDILTDRGLLMSARLEAPMLTKVFSDLNWTDAEAADIPLTLVEAKYAVG
jgi:hypothetical protein